MNRIHNLKYVRSKTLGCNHIDILKSEFVAKTQFLFYISFPIYLLFKGVLTYLKGIAIPHYFGLWTQIRLTDVFEAKKNRNVRLEKFPSCLSTKILINRLTYDIFLKHVVIMNSLVSVFVYFSIDKESLYLIDVFLPLTNEEVAQNHFRN